VIAVVQKNLQASALYLLIEGAYVVEDTYGALDKTVGTSWDPMSCMCTRQNCGGRREPDTLASLVIGSITHPLQGEVLPEDRGGKPLKNPVGTWSGTPQAPTSPRGMPLIRLFS
jgi:hypothetical protein